MPVKYEKWQPKFSSNDVVTVEEHMSSFWVVFQLNPVSDDVEAL
jgi:hypothetical protein